MKKEDGQSPVALCVYGFLSGFLYGWIMNLYYIIGWVRPFSWKAAGAAYVSSFFFDLSHGDLYGAGTVAGGRALGQEAPENQEKIWADRRGSAL